MYKFIYIAYKMLIMEMLQNIIKDQNKALLKKIADKYELDYAELERKYLTPTFYSIDVNKDKIYNITFIEK